MADVGPDWKRIAQLTRMLSSTGGERRNAFAALERTMQSEGITWTDTGDRIEHSYSEDEMHQMVDVVRKEERQRAQQTAARSNGHFALPSLTEMADFCHAQRHRLKDDAQRKFIDEMVFATHHQARHLQRGTLGYLVSLYIKHGGKI